MEYIIDCENENQQIKVLQKLEKEGYSWTPSEAPTSFVPMGKDPNAKLIVTKPSLTIAYSNNCERSKEIFQDSHTYITGREYLERKEKRVKKKRYTNSNNQKR